jgi:hypothetical protein
MVDSHHPFTGDGLRLHAPLAERAPVDRLHPEAAAHATVGRADSHQPVVRYSSSRERRIGHHTADGRRARDALRRNPAMPSEFTVGHIAHQAVASAENSGRRRIFIPTRCVHTHIRTAGAHCRSALRTSSYGAHSPTQRTLLHRSTHPAATSTTRMRTDSTTSVYDGAVSAVNRSAADSLVRFSVKIRFHPSSSTARISLVSLPHRSRPFVFVLHASISLCVHSVYHRRTFHTRIAPYARASHRSPLMLAPRTRHDRHTEWCLDSGPRRLEDCLALHCQLAQRHALLHAFC